jgi:biopolymer transport protein ExbD
MRFRRPHETPEATFDLTNMIDVVLLLIIFFMLTAQFARSNQREMDLPREKGALVEGEDELSIVVELDKTGALRVNEEGMDVARLVQIIAADARRRSRSVDALEIVIRADRACPARHLNSLIGALSQVGVKRWKLATSSPEGA